MKDLRVTVELVEHTLHKATARATVRWGKESATFDYTIDVREESEYTAHLRATKGGRAEALLNRIRSELIERTQNKAIHRAREAIKARELTDADKSELNRRGALEPMAPGLDAKVRDHHSLDQAIEAWKRDPK
jgi:hypothetical protein